MASINLPLGNVLNENLWTGSVRVPSVFIKDHALAYIRLVRKTNNDGLRIKLSSTSDGDVNIAGPEFTDAVENYLEAFIFINQDGEELTTPGPNNGTNLESDSAEPYLWRTSNFADVSAFFVGIVNLSITIQDNIQYVSLTGELDVEIQAEGILLVEESEIVIPPAEEVRTSINLPLGIFDDSTVGWEGSVRVPSVFIKNHELAYIRFLQLVGGSLRIRLSSTPDGDPEAIGPEFSNSVENFLEAFIFINQDGEELTTPGPNNETNFFSDPDEPYFWTPPNFNEVSAFFILATNVSITIQDNFQYVPLSSELDVEIQAQGTLLVQEPPPLEIGASINLPLGNFDGGFWLGSVRIPSVFIKNHALAYFVSIAAFPEGGMGFHLSSTPDGDLDAAGPEFTDAVENFLEAFIFINQDGETLTLPGPTNINNSSNDPDEPYNWFPSNWLDIYNTFFLTATSLSITIQDDIQYVPLSSELDIRVNVEGILTVRELQEIQLSGEFNVQIQAQGILTVEEFVLPDQTVTQDSLVLDFNEETGLYERIGNVIVNESALRVWVPGIWIAVTLFAKLPTGDIRLWTGSPNLLLDNEEYLASRILEVSSTGSESDLNSSNRSLKVTVSAIPEIQRVVFLSPVGLAPIRLQTIVSETAGLSWRRVGQEVVGVISSPVLTGYTYTFDVEPRSALVDRARLIYWSHSDRVRRHGAVDQGMSQMPKLSDEGVLGRWPNP